MISLHISTSTMPTGLLLQTYLLISSLHLLSRSVQLLKSLKKLSLRMIHLTRIMASIGHVSLPTNYPISLSGSMKTFWLCKYCHQHRKPGSVFNVHLSTTSAAKHLAKLIPGHSVTKDGLITPVSEKWKRIVLEQLQRDHDIP